MVAPSQALNPEKKGNGDTDVEIQIPEEKKALTAVDLRDDDYRSPYNDTTVPVITVSRRQVKAKRRLWLQLLLFFGMILGLTLCVLGSIRLYNGMYYVSNRYEGRCGVGIIDSDLTTYNNSATYYDYSYDPYPYYEDVKIDGQVETLTTPAAGNASAAVFRHDFDKQYTAIRDDLKEFCVFVPFLKSFVDGEIPNPSNFSYFLSHRDTEDDLPIAHQTDEYFSVGSPVHDSLSEFGAMLSELCDGVKSFRVNPHSSGVMTTEATTTTHAPSHLETEWYTMYPGGYFIYNYHIEMPDEDYLDDYYYEYFK